MTNEYGEYLEYKVKNAKTEQQRRYYESLQMAQSEGDIYTNNNNNTTNTSDGENSIPYSSKQYVPKVGQSIDNSNISNGYEGIEPLTVETDKDLQDALNGEGGDQQGNRDLNLNGTSWDGMQSGAITYNSTQSPNWMATVPAQYREKAARWSDNQGICEIIPIQQRQKFTYSTITYIAKMTQEPKTQRFPISDVSVVPHQINFDMYDTTEGRIGVSNAVEKHQSVEFDVYLTDYVFYYWNFGGDNENKFYIDVLDKQKKKVWNAINNKTYTDTNLIRDLEDTREFITFRNTFLQQHLGWMCQFNSHTFGTFVGVINDVSYQINSGETFAKWHIKLEEAIFTEGYSETGQKPSESETSDSSQTDSGTATDVEETPQ